MYLRTVICVKGSWRDTVIHSWIVIRVVSVTKDVFYLKKKKKKKKICTKIKGRDRNTETKEKEPIQDQTGRSATWYSGPFDRNLNGIYWI